MPLAFLVLFQWLYRKEPIVDVEMDIVFLWLLWFLWLLNVVK